MKVKIGGIYSHYKHHNLYKVIALGKDCQSSKDVVVFEALYPNPLSRIWVRPYHEWCEEMTDHQNNKIPRYTFIKDGLVE